MEMKISIAIPTRARAEYLRPCLATCVAIDDPNLEIIVSDNASEDDTRAVVEGFGDERIVYRYTGRRISQRENFEAAIRAATGDYVMMMGDDDAVLPGQWSRLRGLLEKERPLALTWQPVFYCWPSPYYRAGGGMLRLNARNLTGKLERIRSADVIGPASAFALGRHERLPEIYHGVASRTLIDQFLDKTGHVFLSANIDVYYSFGALALIEHFDRITHPFSIIAMGPKSGGGSMQAQNKTGQDSEILARVAKEAGQDVVQERLSMPFPALAFHLLGGMIEAQRHIAGSLMEINYERWLDILASHMRVADDDRRLRARELLAPYFTSIGQLEIIEALDAMLHALPRPPEARSFTLKGLGKAIEARFSGLSYVLPQRFEVDLKSRNLARVDDAARTVDWLLEPAATKKGFPPAGPLSWPAILGRGARLIVGVDGPPPSLPGVHSP